MTVRATRAARVIALREHGYTIREIANQLGLSHSYTAQLVNDPDGAKVRARKASYGGRCVDCGKATTGCNGPAKAPERCDPCTRALHPAMHGTASKYRHGCTCDLCREARRIYHRDLRLAGREPPSHGISGYTNYGCKCGVCKAAKSAENRRYRALRKAAS